MKMINKISFIASSDLVDKIILRHVMQHKTLNIDKNTAVYVNIQYDLLRYLLYGCNAVKFIYSY